MRKTTQRLISIGVIVTFMTSCSSFRVVHHTPFAEQNTYCAPAIRYSYDRTYLPVNNVDSLLQNNPELKGIFSDHDIRMANAMGILPLIQKLLLQQADSSAQGVVTADHTLTIIQNRLLMASAEIEGIAAELDCEGERADQLANYLDGINRKRNTVLTGASVILGAAVTVAAVAVSNNNTQDAVSVSGGLTAAGLGALLLDTSGKEIKLDFSRNILSDIWFQPSHSEIYSPFTWYVLNKKSFSNSHTISLVQSIKKRWITFELNNRISDKAITLYFKRGGLYNADRLHTRASMLNQLQSTIRSIHQDMQSLIMALDKFLQPNKIQP
jgi:hypothetical protein